MRRAFYTRLKPLMLHNKPSIDTVYAHGVAFSIFTRLPSFTPRDTWLAQNDANRVTTSRLLA